MQKDFKPYDLVPDYEHAFEMQSMEQAHRGKSRRTVLKLVLVILAVLFVCYIFDTFDPFGLKPKDNSTDASLTTVSNLQSEDDYYQEDGFEGEYYVVSVGKGNRLSLRLAPTTESSKLDRIDNGTRLYITAIQDNWGQTEYNGKTGWVCLQEDGETYCVKEE